MLHGHVPAVVARLLPVGSLPGTNRLNLAIGLPLRNPEALTNLLRQIYDPASPRYHHYLTPEQFTEQFGPMEKDYQAVIAFAKANGLKVMGTHPNRMLVDVNGSVADIERVMHVTMHIYQHPTEARTFYAPDVEPSLDLTIRILGISGLNNYSLPRPRFVAKPLANLQTAGPNAGLGPGGTYMGNDFRAAYAPGVTLDGSGQIVGLLEFDGYTAGDITNYESRAGLPNVTLTNVLIDGASGNPSGSGGEIEVSLDIEMAISMAPGLSQVMVYIVPNPSPWEDLLNRMATDNLAKQLSCSWFAPNGVADPTADEIFQQMAAQGQSFFNASGDNDAYTGLIDFPGDSPYITQVGGTTLTTSGPGGAWVLETVWNWGIEFGSSYDGSGSGGGISTQYPIPSWQTNINMTANQGSTTMRNTPDMALTADNIDVRVDGDDWNVGGTSCAAPLWAGFIALVNQQAAATGEPAVGFINPAVDAIGTGSDYTTCFHDITTGNNTWNGSPTQFYAVAGYNLCTGWGTPNGQSLINALANPEALQITPATGFAAPGCVGGPFTITNETFSLTNTRTNSLDWSLANTSTWLVASPSGGTLAAGGTTNVTVTLSSNAYSLTSGIYTATAWFTNLNDGVGQSRQFTLAVDRLTILSQPQSLTVPVGSPASFSVSVFGMPPLDFQWQKNGTNLTDGTNISGSATTNLLLNLTTTNDAGNYTVIIANACGSIVTSSPPATLTFSSGTITWTNTSGGNWSVAANWSPNQVPGATNNANITMSGTYTVTLDENATVASLALGGSSGTQSFVAKNTLTLNGASTVGTNVTFNLDGGLLSGTGSLTVNGPFNWSNGEIYNTVVTLNGASSLSGVDGDAMWVSGLLINAGQLTWGGNGHNLAFYSGTLTNLASGTITITADVSTDNEVGGTIGNAGLLRKADTSATTLDVALVNSGDVQAQGGTLDLAGGGSASGTFEVSNNATLQFSGNTYTLNASGITGAGTVLVSETLNLSGANTIGNNVTFNLDGGFLSGNGSLIVNGPFNWSNGEIYDTVVTLNGASSLSGVDGDAMWVSGLLINAGQLTWGGNGHNLAFYGGTFRNLASGTITITANVSTDNEVGGTIVNAGLLRKADTSATTLDVALVNSGDVQAQGGTLDLAGGGSASGTFEVSNNATLQFSGNTYTLNASSITGAGTVLVSETLNLSGANTIGNNVTFNLDGGFLSGNGSLIVNGPFNWSNGEIYNTVVRLNGASSLSGVDGDAMWLSGLLINAGQLTWGGNGYNLALYSGTLTNLASGTITITADVSTDNEGGGTIVNAGLLRKADTSATTLDVALVNSGDVQAQGGTLDLAGGGSASGTFEVSNNATLQFGGNDSTSYTLSLTSSVTGAGTVLMSSGTVNLNGNFSLSGTNIINGGIWAVNSPAIMAVTNLILSGYYGSLSGNAPVTVNGPFTWSSGVINNTGGVTLNGTSSLSSVGNTELDGLLINAGTLTWGGSDYNHFYFSSGTLTNLATGTITIANDVSTYNLGGGTIVNAGLVRKTNTTGTSTLDVAFVNTGTLDAQSGILSLIGDYSLTNGTLNFGISSLTNFGKISLSGAAALTGTVGANLNNGYVPIAGNSFTVLTYGSRTGIFTTTALPFADAWQTNYTATNFTLVVLSYRLIVFGGTIEINELTTLTTNVVTALDIPPQTLISSLVSAPSGMTLNTNTGVITWTPTQTQSPSTNTVVVSVTNNGTPPLSTTNSFTVIVKEVNVAPTLPVISQQTVNDLARLTVTDTATEFNIHSTNSGYGLINPPDGVSISANGIITWTPSQSQGPSTNTITTVVTNSNPYDLVNPSLSATNSFTVIVFAPTLAPLANFNVNVGQTVSFTASATDNDNTRTLTFSLGAAPAGASINSNGLFNWRPPVTSAGLSNNIQVIVTDNSVPSLSATQSFYALVNPLAPVTLMPLSKTATRFQMEVTGPIGPDYILLATESLNVASTDWVNLLTNTPVDSPFSMTDTNLSAFTNRFYRVKLGP